MEYLSAYLENTAVEILYDSVSQYLSTFVEPQINNHGVTAVVGNVTWTAAYNFVPICHSCTPWDFDADDCECAGPTVDILPIIKLCVTSPRFNAGFCFLQDYPNVCKDKDLGVRFNLNVCKLKDISS
jgi:hypothetical protein